MMFSEKIMQKRGKILENVPHLKKKQTFFKGLSLPSPPSPFVRFRSLLADPIPLGERSF